MDVGELTPADFMRFPIWEYGTDQEHLGASECNVRAVKLLPARHLVERIVGTQVSLANGQRLWALLGGIDLQDEAYTESAIHITILSEGRRLHINRFGQPGFGLLSPDQVANHLGIRPDALFPIQYDLSGICLAKRTILQRSIAASVTAPLDAHDHMAMILRNAPFQTPWGTAID